MNTNPTTRSLLRAFEKRMKIIERQIERVKRLIRIGETKRLIRENSCPFVV